MTMDADLKGLIKFFIFIYIHSSLADFVQCSYLHLLLPCCTLKKIIRLSISANFDGTICRPGMKIIRSGMKRKTFTTSLRVHTCSQYP